MSNIKFEGIVHDGFDGLMLILQKETEGEECQEYCIRISNEGHLIYDKNHIKEFFEI